MQLNPLKHKKKILENIQWQESGLTGWKHFFFPHYCKPFPVFWRCLRASSAEAVETLICLESYRCVVTASCYCYLIGADVSSAGPQRNNTIQIGVSWHGASCANNSDLIVRQGLSGRRCKSRPCWAQTRAIIGWILDTKTCLTFVAQQSSPVDVAHTLPGFGAAAVHAAGEGHALVTQGALPAVVTPEVETVSSLLVILFMHPASVTFFTCQMNHCCTLSLFHFSRFLLLEEVENKKCET